MRAIRFDIIADGIQTPDTLGALALRAEKLGYTALHLGHHTGQQDPLRALLPAAQATTRLRVGTRVLNAGLLSAARLAHDVADIDRLTGGRFELGVGLGWDRADFVAAGRPFESLSVRAARLDTLLNSIVWQRPVPVVVGGQSDAALSVAARHAVGVELTGARAVRAGHRPDRVRSGEVAERIRYLAGAAGQRFADIEVGVRVHVVMVGVPARMAARAIAQASGLSAESIVDSPFALVGTVAEIGDKVRAARATAAISRYSVSAGSMDELAPLINECQ